MVSTEPKDRLSGVTENEKFVLGFAVMSTGKDSPSATTLIVADSSFFTRLRLSVTTTALVFPTAVSPLFGETVIQSSASIICHFTVPALPTFWIENDRDDCSEPKSRDDDDNLILASLTSLLRETSH